MVHTDLEVAENLDDGVQATSVARSCLKSLFSLGVGVGCSRRWWFLGPFVLGSEQELDEAGLGLDASREEVDDRNLQ